MKTFAFANRCLKEMLRDMVSLMFGIAFPAVLLLLLTTINRSIPKEAAMTLFEIQNLAPGIAVFGLSFIALFTGLLISKDRSSAFMLRCLTSPQTASGFLLGYSLPCLLLSVVQTVFCYLFSMVFGLKLTPSVAVAILVSIPTAVFFISLGLLCGTIFNDKQVGTLCGALLTNLSAWLSGAWFDLTLVGGAFEGVANALPFVHAVNAGRAALAGNYAEVFPDFFWVIGYALGLFLIAVVVFMRKMKSDA